MLNILEQYLEKMKHRKKIIIGNSNYKHIKFTRKLNIKSMEIYKSPYWKIYFEATNSLIVSRWDENSSELTNEVYKTEMETYTQFVEKYNATKALVDCFKFGFTISVNIQEWTNENMFPRIRAVGQDRVAILMPEEIITQLSLEQVMEEANGLNFSTNYFSNEPEARKWLLS